VNDRKAGAKRAALTLTDVSNASGVSEMTVSRVLRNRGDVSAATRARVLEAAQRLGYVPNKIAGALASRRVNLVGVVIPSMSNMVFPEVMTGISQVLENTPFQPVMGITSYRPEKEEKVIYEMLSWRPSGLIVAGLEHSDAAHAMMRNARIPVVEIMDIDGTPIDAMVGISHHEAGTKMAQELIARGYRRFGFLGTKMPHDYRARHRLEGFETALNEQGVQLLDREFYSGGSALLKGREMTEAILARTPDLDCLYYSNDMIGAGGLLHCLDNGISVADRLGLAGFNGVELLDGLPRQLATMDARRLETGIRAAEIIAAEALHEPVAETRVVLNPTFRPGDTLRPRKRSPH